MKSKLVMRQEGEEEESIVPLSEVTQADVDRMDGVLGPANAIPFLLMRSADVKEVDLLDLVLRSKQLARSAAASGSKKAREGSKHKLMVGGEAKYPINDCSDVEDAWGLRGQGKGISQDKIDSYIKSAASDLGCSVPGSDEEGDTKRYGKTISSATEQRLRESIAVIQNLLGDTGSYAETPPTATLDDDSTLNKAADSNKEETVGTEVKEKEPKAPVAGVARKVVTKPVQRAGTHGAFDGTHSHEHADGAGGMHTHDHAHDGDADHGHDNSEVAREQAPRVGSMNAPSMGGTGSGGRVSTPNLDGSSAGGDIGTAGPVADLDVPEQNVVDGEGNMKAAVASTAAVVKLATSEEESPDIGQQIARSIGNSITAAIKEGFKPLEEQLKKIAAEDSRGQQKPFRRGQQPESDYHLVRRNGEVVIDNESEQLQRALEQLDPTTRDIVTRQLAKNAHPLLANKPQQ